MTNFEQYKKEIKEMAEEGIRVSVVNNKPKNCHETECHKCDLYKSGNCQTSLIEWLYEEYTEPKPTLTRTERNFIESFRHPKNKVLVRDDSGLYINYDNKPELRYFSLQKDTFKFIKVGETWKLEDLIKLEVEEWEKAKEEIKVGDVCMSNAGNCFAIRTIDREKGNVEILWKDLSSGIVTLDFIKSHCTNTDRRIDIDSISQQIGGKEK